MRWSWPLVKASPEVESVDCPQGRQSFLFQEEWLSQLLLERPASRSLHELDDTSCSNVQFFICANWNSQIMLNNILHMSIVFYDFIAFQLSVDCSVPLVGNKCNYSRYLHGPLG